MDYTVAANMKLMLGIPPDEQLPDKVVEKVRMADLLCRRVMRPDWNNPAVLASFLVLCPHTSGHQWKKGQRFTLRHVPERMVELVALGPWKLAMVRDADCPSAHYEMFHVDDLETLGPRGLPRTSRTRVDEEDPVVVES